MLEIIRISGYGVWLGTSPCDGSIKGNVGKVGKIGKVSNFGAVDDGSIKGNVSKIGKVSNFGAMGDGSEKGKIGKIGKVGKVSILVL